MEIVRENNQIKFIIPDDILEITEIQKFIDYLRFREITSKSKADQADANKLSDEINQTWWNKNKHKFE